MAGFKGASKAEEIKIKIAEIKSQDDAAFAVIEANKVLVEDSVQSEAKFVESNEIIDKMSDQEAYLHYVSQLKAVSPPELETKKFQSYINTIVKSIDTFYNIK